MTNKSPGLTAVRNTLFETYREELTVPISVFITADDILEDAVANGLTQTRCHRRTIAGATLLSCRIEDVPRVADDLAPVTSTPEKEITANQIRNEVSILKRETNVNALPPDAETFLHYYADQLSATNETRSVAVNLIELAHETGMTNGPAPTSVAAGALDAARRTTDEGILQEDISTVSHVTPSQLRKYCQKLMNTQQPSTVTA